MDWCDEWLDLWENWVIVCNWWKRENYFFFGFGVGVVGVGEIEDREELEYVVNGGVEEREYFVEVGGFDDVEEVVVVVVVNKR